MNLLIDQHKDDWYYSWATSLIVFLSPVIAVSGYYSGIFFGGNGIAIGCLLLAPFAFFVIFPLCIRFRVTADMIWIFCFLLVSWLVSLFGNVIQLKGFLTEAVYIFVMYYPFYCLVRNIGDFSIFRRILYKAAVLSLVLMSIMTLSGVLLGGLFEEGEIYNQTFALIITPAAVIFLVEYLNESGLRDLIGFAISLAMLVYYGSRTSIVCLAIAIGLHCFNGITNRKYRKAIRTSKYIAVTLCAVVGILLLGAFITREGPAVTYKTGNRLLYLLRSGRFFSPGGRGAFCH